MRDCLAEPDDTRSAKLVESTGVMASADEVEATPSGPRARRAVASSMREDGHCIRLGGNQKRRQAKTQNKGASCPVSISGQALQVITLKPASGRTPRESRPVLELAKRAICPPVPHPDLRPTIAFEALARKCKRRTLACARRKASGRVAKSARAHRSEEGRY